MDHFDDRPACDVVDVNLFVMDLRHEYSGTDLVFVPPDADGFFLRPAVEQAAEHVHL